MARLRQLVPITSVLISHATSQMRQPKVYVSPLLSPLFVRIEFLPAGKGV